MNRLYPPFPFFKESLVKKKKFENILFVCTANRMRSRTAEDLYKDDRRFKVQSAGTSSFADSILTGEMLQWADLIVVMEKRHRDFIRKNFPGESRGKEIAILNIPDMFDYMEPALVKEIREKFEQVYVKALRELQK